MRIPATILPRDGRFGSGPSAIPWAAVASLQWEPGARPLLGTSHRQAPVRSLVGRIRDGLLELLGAPEGHEVILGNGGSTAFWDAAAFGLVADRAAHGVFGEFSSKFASATAAPFLSEPLVARAEYGSMTLPPASGADVYAWPHNETSTGVVAPVTRVATDGLIVIDATSAAGAIEVDLSAADVYYFAPQKAFASDGGLWLAVVSPAAVERIEQVAASGRYIPAFLNLQIALTNSRQNQTYNTPALATLQLLAAQLDTLLAGGGLPAAAARCRESSGHLYEWAQSREFARPFVADAELRSPVVATIDLEGIDATALNGVLRENGVVDTFAYRALGRNQIRVGCFPAVDPDDVRALTATIDWVAERL